ncbi:MAG: hypothetical protein HY259_10975 [Chloroflexi bacterium]|nr:hypothetical protein [Chloroflexota bacterium]
MSEYAIVIPSSGPQLQLALNVVNWDRTNAPADMGSIPGAMKFELTDYPFAVPTNTIPITVGPQQLPGGQIIIAGHPAPDYPDVSRTIVIYFTAGNRQWVAVGYLSPPQDFMLRNTDTFYHILGSLRYDAK